MHAFSLQYSAHLKPLCHLFSLQSVKKKNKNRRLCYFTLLTKPTGSVSGTGNCCKNQTLFLLRSAREGRKRDSVKKRGKKSLVPTHESRKILKTFNSRSKHRDWGLFLNMPLVTSCILMQKWFRFVRQSCLRDWLLLNTKQLGNRSVCSFLEASLKSDSGEFQRLAHKASQQKTPSLSAWILISHQWS